jgi:23S rRNA (guanosine2251-2'-O)-methyltransferase
MQNTQDFGKAGPLVPGLRNKSLIIWGIHPVREFLEIRPDDCQRLFVSPFFGKKKAQASLLRLAERHAVFIERTENIESIGVPAGTVHQGVAALVKPVWSIDFSSLPLYWRNKSPLVLACDQITDPQNIGAILRSSVAIGAQAILLPGRRTGQITGAVAKSSSGALFHIKVCQVGNLVMAMKQLKEMGLWIAGLSPDAKHPIWELDLNRPLALVVGAEGAGLRRLVKKTCDFLARIPHFGPIGSMNVASAASIALYEVARQRNLSPVYTGMRW